MDLEPGEQVIFEGHPSWRSTLDFYVKGLVLAALVGALAAGVSRVAEDEVRWAWVAVAAIAVVAVMFVAGWIKRMTTTYTITDHRLHIRRGFIARREQQTQLDRVQNVNTDQSVLQRVLRIGTVDFDTAAGDDYEFRFSGVGSPGEVVAAVHKAQRDAGAAR